jgi:CBS domain-containing protein
MKTLQQILKEKKHQELVSIAPDRPVYDALVIMAEYKIGALAVMDGDKLVGIFSERDYAREMVLKGRSSKTTNVSEVMTKEVLTASPNDLVDTAMSLMTEKRIRHLPIVENGQVLGMLSVGDLVKETISYQKQLIAQLEQYIRG